MRKVKSPAKPASKDVYFGHLIYQATKAANDAGDIWITSHTKPVWNVIDGAGNSVGQLLDVCGFAFVQVKDKRTAFAKWLKTVQISWDGTGYNDIIRINSKYDRRQELGLKEVCAEAVYKVLTDAGIKGLNVYSRID